MTKTTSIIIAIMSTLALSCSNAVLGSNALNFNHNLIISQPLAVDQNRPRDQPAMQLEQTELFQYDDSYISQLLEHYSAAINQANPQFSGQRVASIACSTTNEPTFFTTLQQNLASRIQVAKIILAPMLTQHAGDAGHFTGLVFVTNLNKVIEIKYIDSMGGSMPKELSAQLNQHYSVVPITSVFNNGYHPQTNYDTTNCGVYLVETLRQIAYAPAAAVVIQNMDALVLRTQHSAIIKLKANQMELDRQQVKQYRKDAKNDDAEAQFQFGCYYQQQDQSVKQNQDETVKWLTLAAKQGHVRAQSLLGLYYLQQEPSIKENQDEAVKWLALAADQGDVNAIHLLGMYCLDFDILNENPERTIKYLTLFAKQGNVNAKNMLGMCYKYGIGVGQNPEEAVKWFILAAKQGNDDAQHELGRCYMNGRGVNQDPGKAFDLFTLAAEQGNDGAQYDLGRCYMNGTGVNPDPGKAFYWFILAAKQGHSSAQYQLGMCYINGIGVGPKPEEAVKWFILAAKQEDYEAQYQLGIYYINVKQDRGEAIKWLTLAAKQGHAKAQFLLGFYYLQQESSVKQNREEAVKWLTLAADQGHADAQYELGVCYINGTGVDKDPEQAIKWLTLAAEQGKDLKQEEIQWLTALAAKQERADVQFLIGICYQQKDLGVKENQEQAIKWLTLAAKQGHAKSQYRLGVCYQKGSFRCLAIAITYLQLADDQKIAQAKSALWNMQHLLQADKLKLRQEPPTIADFENAEVQCKIGKRYQHGDAYTEKNDQEAFRWFDLAAKQEHAEAKRCLGIYYQNGGIGIKQDKKKAIELFESAAQQNNKLAQLTFARKNPKVESSDIFEINDAHIEQLKAKTNKFYEKKILFAEPKPK